MGVPFSVKLKDAILGNIFLVYTFAVLLLKSIVFIGITLDNVHTSIIIKLAYSLTMNRISFYSGFILIFLSIAFLLKGRAHVWYLIIINATFSFLLLVDLCYFRGFSTMPTLHVLRQSANLENLQDSVFAMLHKKDIIFVFDILLVVLITLIAKNPLKKIKRNFYLFVIVFIISVGAIAYLPVKNAISDVKDRTLLVYMYDSTVTCYNLSPIGYNLYSVYSYWNDVQALNLTEKRRKEIKEWFEQKKENLPDNKYKALFKGKNLVIIQVESLENFVINQKINGQEITPNLNRLLKNSLYFPDYYMMINEGTSSDADLMTNTSVYPIRQGSTFFRYPATTYNSLPKLLQENGYSTIAIHPDSGSFWNWRVALSNIGFQKCIDASSYDHSEVIGLGISDGSYLKQIEPMITKEKQPFYAFVVTLTSHTPFNLPNQYRELKLDPEFDRTVLGGYFQSVHYTDKHIGLFLDKLKTDGLLDNTVVAIYGDHEGVHKYFTDAIRKIQPSQSWWIDNQKKIPLIIYQNRMQGEKVGTIGGQIDLMPTMLYLMGVDENKYAYSAMGRNLLKTNKSFAVLNDKTFVSDAEEEKNKEFYIKGLETADSIIRGNYFKK